MGMFSFFISGGIFKKGFPPTPHTLILSIAYSYSIKNFSINRKFFFFSIKPILNLFFFYNIYTYRRSVVPHNINFYGRVSPFKTVLVI